MYHRSGPVQANWIKANHLLLDPNPTKHKPLSHSHWKENRPALHSVLSSFAFRFFAHDEKMVSAPAPTPLVSAPAPDRKHIYGFVAWIAIHILYSLFLLWSYLPVQIMHDLGVTYHPDKHWALALPCFVLVSLFTTLVFYASYTLIQLPPLESMNTIIDEHARMPQDRDLNAWSHDEMIPGAVDLPITFVNKVMSESAAAAAGNATRKSAPGVSAATS